MNQIGSSPAAFHVARRSLIRLDARSAARRWASESIKAFQISGRTANEGALPSASTTSVIEDFIDWPVSASHTDCTCERMSSSLVRSNRGACTEPATIWSLRRNQ